VEVDEGQSSQNKMDTQTIISVVLDVAVSTKKNENLLRRTTHHIRARISKFIEVEFSKNYFDL
jgi:hypothetical protein